MSKILVADSGGTKTDWAMVGEEGISFRCTTLGMHPIHLSSSRLREVVVDELLPVLPIHVDVSAIYFYGGGCTPQMCPVVEEALRSCFLVKQRFMSRATCWEPPARFAETVRALPVYWAQEQIAACMMAVV